MIDDALIGDAAALSAFDPVPEPAETDAAMPRAALWTAKQTERRCDSLQPSAKFNVAVARRPCLVEAAYPARRIARGVGWQRV